MINTRFLSESDATLYDGLTDEVEHDLEHKEWWIPITKKSRAMFFDGKSAVIIGAFNEKNELVAASGMFFYEALSETNVSTLGDDLAEIGRCMVRPEYRGENLMLKLNRELIRKARQLGKKSVVATSHPDNKPSCKSLETLGFTKKMLVKKWNNYSRNYYTYDIKDVVPS